jgi:tetratricopeptide (TPR) repeat protein
MLTGLLVLWILGTNGLALGQAGKGRFSLEGVVLNPEGTPVPGAKVIVVLNEQGLLASDLEGNPVPLPGTNILLLRKNVAAKREVDTDENGRWAVRLLQRGMWRLQAYSEERMSVVSEIMVRMSKNDIELVLSQTDTELLIESKAAIYEGRWEKALESLKVFDVCFPDSRRLDNALYWLGFSRRKLGESAPDGSEKCRHFSEAVEDLDRLISTFPDSEWRDDAMVLRIEIALLLVKEGQDSYEHLIIDALDFREPDQKDVRLAALEAYTYIDSEKALQLLMEVTSAERDPETRKKCVYILGSIGGKKLLPFLRRISEQDPDESVRCAARIWLK